MTGSFALQRFLADALSDSVPTPVEMTDMVADLWNAGNFVARCEPALGLIDKVVEQSLSAPGTGYGAGSGVRFQSWLLFGDADSPTGILVDAPPEIQASVALAAKNRAPHVHHTARIAFITRGNATFFARRSVANKDYVIEIPLQANDAVCWPGLVPHTFDAGGAGFSLLTLMPAYEDPGADGYSQFSSALGTDLDALPLMAYEAFRSRTNEPPAVAAST